MDASPDVRAQRRAAQGFDDDLAYRDKIDSSRRASPLTIAEDAHVIDSSHLTIDGVVGEIIGRLKIKGLPTSLETVGDSDEAYLSSRAHRMQYCRQIGFNLKVYGRENLIEEGPAIVASNHQSYLDPPMIGCVHRRELYYLARSTLFDTKDTWLGPQARECDPGRSRARRHRRDQNDHPPYQRRPPHDHFSRRNAVNERPAPASEVGPGDGDRQNICACRTGASVWHIRSLTENRPSKASSGLDRGWQAVAIPGTGHRLQRPRALSKAK